MRKRRQRGHRKGVIKRTKEKDNKEVIKISMQKWLKEMKRDTGEIKQKKL